MSRRAVSRHALRGQAALVLCVLVVACSGGSLPTSADIDAIRREAEEGVRGGSPAREAVRESLRTLAHLQRAFEEDVGRLFQRPHLKSYLMLPDSFAGETFPAEIAALLRKVEQLERDHADALRDYPAILDRSLSKADVSPEARASVQEGIAAGMEALHRPQLEALDAHRRFVALAAELYELVASRPGALKSMREGVVTTDASMEHEFNRLVDEVNAARDAAEAAIVALPREQQAGWRRMGVITPVAR